MTLNKSGFTTDLFNRSNCERLKRHLKIRGDLQELEQPSLNKGFHLTKEHLKYDGWPKLSPEEYGKMAHLVGRLAAFGIEAVSLATRYNVLEDCDSWRFDWITTGWLSWVKRNSFEGEDGTKYYTHAHWVTSRHLCIAAPRAGVLVCFVRRLVEDFTQDTIAMGRA